MSSGPVAGVLLLAAAGALFYAWTHGLGTGPGGALANLKSTVTGTPATPGPLPVFTNGASGGAAGGSRPKVL